MPASIQSNSPCGGPWLRTKDNPPEVTQGRQWPPQKKYWVIWHSIRSGHHEGVGYYHDEFGWNIDGNFFNWMPKSRRPRVVWHAEILIPEHYRK